MTLITVLAIIAYIGVVFLFETMSFIVWGVLMYLNFSDRPLHMVFLIVFGLLVAIILRRYGFGKGSSNSGSD